MLFWRGSRGERGGGGPCASLRHSLVDLPRRRRTWRLLYLQAAGPSSLPSLTALLRTTVARRFLWGACSVKSNGHGVLAMCAHARIRANRSAGQADAARAWTGEHSRRVPGLGVGM
eukprot:575760-Prymnesium_polylepis.1